uniref:Putative secreted peptide n=1 Tax=Anopheles braziliensis TaxID=58242 RepID=A0A2M3ZQH9_9DIPT
MIYRFIKRFVFVFPSLSRVIFGAIPSSCAPHTPNIPAYILNRQTLRPTKRPQGHRSERQHLHHTITRPHGSPCTC